MMGGGGGDGMVMMRHTATALTAHDNHVGRYLRVLRSLCECLCVRLERPVSGGETEKESCGVACSPGPIAHF
jgi:hypothetical protein